MIESRKAIKAYLETLHPRVYYEDAPSKAALPYIVFSFQPSSTPDESKLQRMIDIDIWDIPTDNDTTAIETLAKTIKGDGNLRGTPTGLDEQRLETDEIKLLARFESDQYVKDNDQTVKHILQNYVITIFEKEVT